MGAVIACKKKEGGSAALGFIADWSFRLGGGGKGAVCFLFIQRVSRLVNHFASDAGILNLGIPVGKAPPLLFSFFRSKNSSLSGFEQMLQMSSHSTAPFFDAALAVQRQEKRRS
jgi:hypothetical protein